MQNSFDLHEKPVSSTVESYSPKSITASKSVVLDVQKQEGKVSSFGSISGCFRRKRMKSADRLGASYQLLPFSTGQRHARDRYLMKARRPHDEHTGQT